MTRIYRVNWKDRRPFIEYGEETEFGVKRKSKRGQFKTESNATGYSYSIKSAIEDEINNCSLQFGPCVFLKREPEPWNLVQTITRLWRLYRTLQKHGLIPRKVR